MTKDDGTLTRKERGKIMDSDLIGRNLKILYVAKLVCEEVDENDLEDLTRSVTTLWQLYSISEREDIFHLHNQMRILELEALLKAK